MKALQDAQHDQRDDALTVGRQLCNRVALVLADNRRNSCCVAGGKVIGSHDTALGGQVH
jgi:hypothetical protein